MNTASASPAEPTLSPQPIWDLAQRVSHWAMVLCVAGAWLTAESERWRLLHITLGYSLGGLLLWRLVWGLVGSRHARFSQFVRSPLAAGRYLLGLLRGQPAHHAGHNPAGAWAILGLLALGLGVVASGWANDNGLAGLDWEELHEALAQGLLLLAGLHVAGVLLGSLRHRENLLRAMLTGRKQAEPTEALGRGSRWAGRAMAGALVVTLAGFWAGAYTGAWTPPDASGLLASAGVGGHNPASLGAVADPGETEDDEDEDD